MDFNRRNFLRAMSLGAQERAAGRPPLPPAQREPPKRLILVSSEHGALGQGWAMNPWRRRSPGAWQAPLSSLSAAQFSDALAPLYPHRARASVLDGLSLTTAALDAPAEPLCVQRLHAWTGGWVQLTEAGVSATGPSIDQRVAAELARTARPASLALGLGDAPAISHDEGARALPVERDPRALWRRLFALKRPGEPRSALEAALAEYAAHGEALAAAERARVGAGLSLAQALKRGVEALPEDAAQLADTAEGYDQLVDSFGALIAAAFTCDLTRVVTLSLGAQPGPPPTTPAERAAYSRRHAAQLARLVATLEATPEGEGSLMDHVLIVWGAAPHRLGAGFPVVTLGGQWFFSAGRYLRWPRAQAAQEGALPGLPHQHLLVSVARAMGLDVEAVGTDVAWTQGGELIDLTGEIFEMY